METKKYVRTKDGVYKSVDYDEAKYRATILGSIYWPRIIKQADKIKDLCDAFVNVETAGGFEGEFHVYRDFELAKYAADEKVTETYGAIRTDKGLIYVAKVNDKGELELL